jgi:hypothetical protein
MSEGVRERRWQLAVRLGVAALVWSLGLVLAALLIGAYSGQTASMQGAITLTTRTFVQVNGVRSLVLVALPVAGCLVVGVALGQRRRRGSTWSGRLAWTAVAVVAVEAALGMATFGLFLVPVVVLLVLSVRLVPGPTAAPRPVRRAPATDP